VRKALLILGVLVALAVPTAAIAKAPPAPPTVICGGSCDGGGGGWSGCTQQTESHSAGIPLLATVRHYLVVSYCKSNGTITSISIAAHGCDVGGIMYCNVSAAWQTGGGVGSGYATFEAHATWGSTSVPGYNNNDVLHLTVSVG
jgi:hypothetical protein